MKLLVAGIAVLVVVGLVIEHWVFILFAAAALATVAVAWLLAGWLRDRRRGRIRERQLIAARADAEHERYLAGDVRGVYGAHMPADLDGHLGSLGGVRRLPSSMDAWRDERRGR